MLDNLQLILFSRAFAAETLDPASAEAGLALTQAAPPPVYPALLIESSSYYQVFNIENIVF